MSAVDVLAVMDEAIPAWEIGCDHDRLIDMREARAAVAELIEADKEYDAALAAYATATRNESIHRMADRHAAAVERRKAALAACQSPTTPLTREQEAEEVHKR